MIKTVEMKICDVCKKEVKDFAGSLELRYADQDYSGCGFPVEFIREDICIDCCRKLHDVIEKVLLNE